jgi:VWFA-related protein
VRSNVEIVTKVELVQIPVVVFDAKGAVATDLHKNDFRVVEDGVEQRILYFERERVPVSFVILADVSSSMTKKIPFVQEAALSLVDTPEQQAKYADEFSVLGIESRASMLLPFTNDQKDMERRLPLLLSPTNGSTALFDGIYFGVSTANKQASNDHRAVIIISDGGDNHSRYNLRQTKEMLEEEDVPVFAVMAGPSFELPSLPFSQERKRNRFPTERGGGRQSPGSSVPLGGDDYIGPAERRGPHNLKTLTEATGGGVFTAREQEDLPRIVRTIGLAVRYRYFISYKPLHEKRTDAAREMEAGDSNLHKVHIELIPKEKFKGYSLPYYKRSYHGRE